MAYRTAEQTRWCVGYEIKLSQSYPWHDACDTLAGKYPKTFKWTGWHPPIIARESGDGITS